MDFMKMEPNFQIARMICPNDLDYHHLVNAVTGEMRHFGPQTHCEFRISLLRGCFKGLRISQVRRLARVCLISKGIKETSPSAAASLEVVSGRVIVARTNVAAVLFINSLESGE